MPCIKKKATPDAAKTTVNKNVLQNVIEITVLMTLFLDLSFVIRFTPVMLNPKSMTIDKIMLIEKTTTERP